ncbi:hypothetical protein PoB_006684400 [Plakobranchus ocellatus]|uniref:Uncharacterized protein n=1 Tax=Plakobranchus ocellatus TaxID=259542 RepID=A0AAV4D830_9GAST|nr:hypothetical protein PoB_006684400 [Plakobranchus ocellatus]
MSQHNSSPPRTPPDLRMPNTYDLYSTIATATVTAIDDSVKQLLLLLMILPSADATASATAKAAVTAHDTT